MCERRAKDRVERLPASGNNPARALVHASL